MVATLHRFEYEQQYVACTDELPRRYSPKVTQCIVDQGSAIDVTYLESLNMPINKYINIDRRALLLGFTGVLVGCGGGSLNSIKNYEYIDLVNNLNIDISFTLEINGKGLLFSSSQVIQEIQTTLDENNRGLPYKIWVWLLNNRYHFDPFTSERWAHTPYIFANSIGFGYCDDVAAVMAILINDIGGEARIWSLSGHVVPEVKLSGRWEIYDPDLGVVYIDSAGRLMDYNLIVSRFDSKYFASNLYVENSSDIRQNILKANGINPSTSIVKTEIYGYSDDVKNLYQSTNDNYVENFYLEGFITNIYPEKLTIPGNSVIRIHGRTYSSLNSMYNTLIPKYGLMSLEIKPHTEGSVNIPLYLLSVQGNGSIIINNKKYEIPGAELVSVINSRLLYNQNFQIKSTDQGLKLIFMLNSTRFNLESLGGVILDVESSKYFNIISKSI